MFQYAFARKIQEETGKKIVLDISDFESDEQRDYSLDKFKLNKNITIDSSGKYNKIYDKKSNFIIKVLQKISPNLCYKLFSKYDIYIWDFARYKEIKINNLKENIFIHGYWQSNKYFDNMNHILSEELKVKQYLLKDNKLYKSIENENSVCVHIRRGDFLLKTNKLTVCTNDYFINAMKIIADKVENCRFYIFSDDIDNVKENFSFNGFDVRFVEENNNDYEELSLMSSCKHFIISNSTFSWWAQYLSESKNKIVIAPSKWYTDDRNNDLVDDSWITLNP